MSKKTKDDPTGQARNRNRGTKRLHSRLKRAEARARELFKEIPRERRRVTKIKNNQSTQADFYDYEFSALDQQQLDQSINFILGEQLLETQVGTMQPGWYWQDNVEQPYRQGTLEEVRDFNQLVASAIVAGVVVAGLPPRPLDAQRVLFSERYREALNNVYVSNFNAIKSLSDTVASQVSRQINAGIQSKLSPIEIGRQITERFDVAESSAKRIAETEINKAYTNAKLGAVEMAAQDTGLRSAVIHTSALTPTTRTHHAARHGNAYTTEDQRSWWDSGSNRINCKCSITSVLVDKRGNIVQSELQDSIKSEKSFFNNVYEIN